MNKRQLRSRIIAGLFLPIFSILGTAEGIAGNAPFGNEVSPAISYYNRATSQIATSGSFDTKAIPEIISHGFKTVIELRTLEEMGVKENAEALSESALNFFHIPVSTRAPTIEQVASFTALLSNPDNYPILVNCQTANRVGAMWTLYRVGEGVPIKFALEEGRTAGLTSREPAVRKRLGIE